MQMSASNDTFRLAGPDLLDLLDLRWEPEKETAENFYTGLRNRYSGTYGSTFRNILLYLLQFLQNIKVLFGSIGRD